MDVRPLAALLALTMLCCTARSEPDDSGGGNRNIASFATAKRLARQVYADHRQSFYCGCAFSEALKPQPGACGYVARTQNKRAGRIEWEHVVPAEAFGRSFAVWRQGDAACVSSRGKPFKGRNCARKVSQQFRRMEADLHNLVPALGELNGRRKSYSMGMVDGEARDFGACDVEIAGRKIEPRPQVRGDVARVYLYMDAAYPGRGIVSRKNSTLFAAWAAEDPVDAWECLRDERIARLQGNSNPFVAEACGARRATGVRAR